jgi:hypothetical protein
LRLGTFTFSGEKGITLPKGKGKTGVRPLVISPIANRIVRRGILDVLQGYGGPADRLRHRWAGIPAIRQILATPTSVGGIRKRGVPHGLALLDEAVRTGHCYFARSDIKNFFTRIPKALVNEFVRNAVDDPIFANLFDEALATNLINREELEERNLFKLFPDPQVGAAQGSALSALAGNIALREFDSQFNGRGVICVRYIDDFVLLGSSEAKVHAAYRSASNLLSKLEMEVYLLSDEKARKDEKVDSGNIYNGTVFLGYRISGRSLQPSNAACKKFLQRCDRIVADGVREMRIASTGGSVSSRSTYHQTMVLLDRTIWGWSQAFRQTTARHVFEQLDREIDKRIDALRFEARELIAPGNRYSRRRVMGVHLLQDTPHCDLRGNDREFEPVRLALAGPADLLALLEVQPLAAADD